MRAWILRKLNIPGILFFSACGLMIQSTMFGVGILRYLQPDFVLLIVLWLSLKRSLNEGAIFVLILGYLAELSTSAPRGLLMSVYFSIFLAARLVHQQLQVIRPKTLALVSGVCGVMSKIGILFILYLLNKAENQALMTLKLVIPHGIVQALLGPFAFQFLLRFDQWTLKAPGSYQQYHQDHQLDEEWI